MVIFLVILRPVRRQHLARTFKNHWERVEAPPGFEPGMEVLQTSALPLGDGADRELASDGGSNRLRARCQLMISDNSVTRGE
jgi:hypothetical protein